MEHEPACLPVTQIIMMIPIAIGNDFISENPLNQCYQSSICIPFVGFLEMPLNIPSGFNVSDCLRTSLKITKGAIMIRQRPQGYGEAYLVRSKICP